MVGRLAGAGVRRQGVLPGSRAALPACLAPSRPLPCVPRTTRPPPAATGLVRLDLHDNPITADFAADLAAVLARQGQARRAERQQQGGRL